MADTIGKVTLNGSTVALATSPYIGDNKHWFVWNYSTQQYVDTEIPAQMTGNVGLQGVGIDSTKTVDFITTSGNDYGKLKFHLYDPASPTTSVSVLTSNSVKGDAGTLTISKVITGAPGSVASVTNSGDSHSAVLEITIPRGDTGAAATIAAGTATSLSAGSTPTVSNKGTTSAAVFDFGIPKGDGIASATVDSNKLTFTTDTGKTLTAGTITAGNVDTVNSKSPTTGSKNVVLTGDDINVSSSDSNSIASTIGLKANSSTVTTLTNRVTSTENNISTLSGRVTTAETNITSLNGRIYVSASAPTSAPSDSSKVYLCLARDTGVAYIWDATASTPAWVGLGALWK